MIKHSAWVTSDYVRAVGLTVTQGRGFTPADSARSRRVSVINETLAQRYFRGQNPIGRRWGNSSNFASDGIEIVGVVTDARYNDVKAGSIAMSYMPALQSQRYLRSIEVRSSGNPGHWPVWYAGLCARRSRVWRLARSRHLTCGSSDRSALSDFSAADYGVRRSST
jgi:hypothetical protein